MDEAKERATQRVRREEQEAARAETALRMIYRLYILLISACMCACVCVYVRACCA